jgi:hypothetical protein
VGLTDCVPPVALKAYELPSVPDTVTCVALAAVTVRVDELPELMRVGLAAIATVGAGGGRITVTAAVAVAVPPAPIAVAV